MSEILSQCCKAEIGPEVCRKHRHDGISDDGRCGTCGQYLPNVCTECGKRIVSQSAALIEQEDKSNA